jgi:membrane associated rhomboid family serine protease
VAEAARAAPVLRTPFGGRLRGGRPVVTQTVLGLCAALFLLQQVSPLVTSALAFSPALAAPQPWRFLTAAFLHSPSNLLHILFNLYALYLTGPYLEQVLGRARFAALYLLSALGGSVGFLLLTSPAGQGWYAGTVGASGAVFGLFGALLVVQRRLHRQTGQIVGVLVVNGVLGFVLPSIAWQAHLGGLLTGVAVAAVLVHAVPARGPLTGGGGRAGAARSASRRTALQVGGTAGVLVLLVTLALGKLAATGGL